MTRQEQDLDPRGPRFGAGITAVLLLVVVGLALPTASLLPPTAAERAAQPAFVLAVLLAALFLWGTFAGVGRHPWGLLYKSLVRPRLTPPREFEDPAAPTFAQGVGAFVTLVGIVLHLVGTPWGLAAAAAAAFIAAFLNAVFGYCLGCQMYTLFVRSGLIRRSSGQA